jgi:hypothetical protein
MPPDSPKPSKPAIYTSAFICQSSISAKNGLVTAVNIGDIFHTSHLEFDLTLPNGITQTARVFPPVNVTLIMMFRSEEPTEFDLRFEGKLPNGELLPGDNRSHVKLDRGVKGAFLNIDLTIDPRYDGEMWFEIYIDEELATKIPFLIVRTQKPSPQSALPDSTTGAAKTDEGNG